MGLGGRGLVEPGRGWVRVLAYLQGQAGLLLAVGWRLARAGVNCWPGFLLLRQRGLACRPLVC